jgi:hypothetical protein
MVACGAIMVFWETHPFFLDEWAIIYNLKYKTSGQLWGGLDKVQQFPRVYLHIIQWFSSMFNYSYISLRLPSFLVHCFGLWYCIYLSKRIFKDNVLYQWLWVLLYAAYPTSVFYFVLTKQYTMEMLLGLVGIAQLILLININNGKNVSNTKYLLLCLSFLIAPLFSYTYPMIAAPIFGVVLLNTISKGKDITRQWIALVCCAIGIIALYKLDITQVMKDQGMANYWKDYYMVNGFNFKELCYHLYMCFALFGRGAFMVVMAVVGLAAWLFGTYQSIGILKRKEKSIIEWLVLYSVSLIWLSVVLFIMNKLPLNAHRLNAYKTAAAGILIVYMFLQMQKAKALHKVAIGAASVVFILQILFIVQPLIKEFAGVDHKKKMMIYNNGKTAILLAEKDKLPIFTTSMTLYPHADIDVADWVIKCYPAYKKGSNIPVFPIVSGASADSLLHTLRLSSAVVTTGDSVFVLLNDATAH